MVVDGDLTFIEDTHQYLYKGVLIPSVSEILKYIFPNKYKGVSKETLNKKANYGSVVHKYIELFENGRFEELPQLDLYQKLSFKQYCKLVAKNDIKVLEQEKMIHYEDYYAGRFDMIANIKGKECLCDIKTTAELDMEYLSWQLSLYEFAYGKKFKKLYAIWLPRKELGKLVEIPRKTKKEILSILKKFRRKQSEKEEINI